MPRKRKKITVRVIHQSPGPLPLKLAERFAGSLLIFSDASQKRYGGLAAVMFHDPDGDPLVRTRAVALVGSNELELQAALFALSEAERHFPGRPLALFSDNQDAVDRLNRARQQGIAQDVVLQQMLGDFSLGATLDQTAICWVKGHASCRGNILADQHASLAAEGLG